MAARNLFTEIRPLYRVALRMGWTSIGKRLRERADQLGYHLLFKPDRLVVRTPNRDFWMSSDNPGLVWTNMEKIEALQSRCIVHQRGGREVIDLRGDQKYRSPALNDLVWLPTLPETVDLIGGYFAKGTPTPGTIAFDVGAYCGEISIAMARQVGAAGAVFSFEPDSHSRVYLERNIKEAGLKNVTVVAKGMWGATTTLSFAEGGDLGSCLTPDSNGAGTQIPVVSFEEACRIAGAVPSFVKMDIEGAEVEAIEGSLEFIARHAIRFAIASYHDRGGQPTSVLLEPLFRKAGYQVLTGHPEHQTTWAWKE